MDLQSLADPKSRRLPTKPHAPGQSLGARPAPGCPLASGRRTTHRRRVTSTTASIAAPRSCAALPGRVGLLLSSPVTCSQGDVVSCCPRSHSASGAWDVSQVGLHTQSRLCGNRSSLLWVCLHYAHPQSCCAPSRTTLLMRYCSLLTSLVRNRSSLSRSHVS